MLSDSPRAEGSPPPSELRRRLPLAVVVLAAVQLALVFSWVRPGPLVIDEVIYQWMIRSVTAGSPLTVDNGFEEFPSAELGTFQMRIGEETLTAQYPYGFPFLATPFYAAFSLHGAFVINALAFVLVLALTWHIGVRLLGDERTALLGTALFLGGTYAWEYSMAAWPQSTALAAQLGAFALMLEGLEAGARARRFAFAAAAGLAAGAALTLRLDTAVLLPALALPFLLASPVRWREVLGLAVGTVPALAFLAVTNWIRWGNPSPFSYGGAEGLGELVRYVPVAAAGGVALAGLWALTRPRVLDALARRPGRAAAGAVAVAAAALVLPPTREILGRLGHGLWALVVDLSGEPATFAGGGQVTSWALLYANGIKKALLQSCPWLPVALLPLVTAVRLRERRRAVLLLVAVPAVVIPFFALRTWHGGLALNLRYFLPTLPFFGLLGAQAVRDLGRGAARETWQLAGVAAAFAAAVYLGLAAARPLDLPEARAPFVMTIPLVLAGLTTALVVAVAVGSGRGGAGSRLRGGAAARTALLATAAAGVVWAGFLAFEYDATWSRNLRTTNLLHSVEVASHLEEGALLFGFYPDWFATVKNLRPDVTVAFPRQDAHADFRPLAAHWLDRGRRVYGVLAPADWQVLRSRGHLDGLTLRVVAGGSPYPLLELDREPPASGSAEPPPPPGAP